MNTITIQRPLGVLTLTEKSVEQLLINKPLLESLLLMFIEGSEVWVNEHEVEFTKKEGIEYLREYFRQHTTYNITYLDKIFNEK